ncbi:hypothetical protein SD70_10370 [Gordoniibacillus kamchatkensis]|uniref:DUF2935 domain-containing protein n=1 Tax=Gordoniibacillus kamchatkensis TaxID=1590651 RepID=A0ABR5AJ09_9BACL|nr:DUF2935 domain-containing protein [Paenibacillus sp. VKM B-2647]KIL41004.1 hypothetical protein SD70_10370 [Paenibacillus sp. VKM B-2647]
MNGSDFEQVALYEHRFWLQIMGDHARFIYRSLAPVEMANIAHAHRFMQIFDHLLEQARGQLASDGIVQLSRQAQHYTGELRQFKLDLLRKLLFGEVAVGLSETFFNHMVNELDEYLRILGFLVQGRMAPQEHPLHHHLLWVSDASAHAAIISANLDVTEKQLKHKGERFETHFGHFYMKAVELAGYLRAHLNDFPALRRFHRDVGLELVIFQDFLKELEELSVRHELLGIISPLMADHMAREECYYLRKLAESTGAAPPPCDPGEPRASEL